MAVRAEIRIHEELAGHAEMDAKADACIGEIDHNVLAMAPHSADRLAYDAFGVATEDTSTAEFGGEDTGPCEARRESTHDSLHFGKLGHTKEYRSEYHRPRSAQHMSRFSLPDRSHWLRWRNRTPRRARGR